MNIIQDVFIAIITTYLAFTNTLADGIAMFMGDYQDQSEIYVEEPTQFDKITDLPSRLGGLVPNWLLNSPEYQQATVAGSAGLVGGNTKEPLDALVNIFCTMTTDDTIRTTTGTGFFIDPDGIIMTNAHVAQFLILESTTETATTDCIIRNGNPAGPRYNAELLYLPPAWILANASVMYQSVPMGTGERDYALLYVNETIDGSPLPAQFPALDFDTSFLSLSTRGSSVTAAGYPAEPLLREGASANLIPYRATTTISELYTFGSNFADVFSIKGSEVGTEGSSGGPVLNEEGKVIGMIVTRGNDSIDGGGSLRAITLSHIERTMLQETNFDLTKNLSGDLAYRSEIFASTVSPFLLTLLQQAAGDN